MKPERSPAPGAKKTRKGAKHVARRFTPADVDAVFQKHADLLLGRAKKLTKGRAEEAADLVQDTYRKLLNLRRTKDNAKLDSPLAYAYAAMRSLCIDRERAKARGQVVPASDVTPPEAKTDPVTAKAVSPPTGSDEILRKKLYDERARWNTKERVVFDFWYAPVGGRSAMSQDELAARLGVGSSQISNIKRKLYYRCADALGVDLPVPGRPVRAKKLEGLLGRRVRSVPVQPKHPLDWATVLPLSDIGSQVARRLYNLLVELMLGPLSVFSDYVQRRAKAVGRGSPLDITAIEEFGLSGPGALGSRGAHRLATADPNGLCYLRMLLETRKPQLPQPWLDAAAEAAASALPGPKV